MGTVVETPKQPDIEYTPNYEKYLARTKRRTQTEDLPKTLPPGFPERVKGKLAWDGRDIAETYNWALELTPAEIAEIEHALQHFKGP
jgi:hypothetical protein